MSNVVALTRRSPTDSVPTDSVVKALRAVLARRRTRRQQVGRPLPDVAGNPNPDATPQSDDSVSAPCDTEPLP